MSAIWRCSWCSIAALASASPPNGIRTSKALLKVMTGVTCLGGQTQIGKVLKHARDEAAKQKVGALVFVGDAFEEDIDEVCHRAGELGLAGVPAFMFQEGRTPLPPTPFNKSPS